MKLMHVFNTDTSGELNSRHDGLMVHDKNNDGKIQSDEVFGTLTTNGFEVLRAAGDANEDGNINSLDAIFNKLRIWQDADSDGVADSGELTTLAERQISNIKLDYVATNYDTNGNVLSAIGSYTEANKQQLIANIDLQFSPTIREIDPLANLGLDSTATLSGDIFELPWLRGFGQMQVLQLGIKGQSTQIIRYQYRSCLRKNSLAKTSIRYPKTPKQTLRGTSAFGRRMAGSKNNTPDLVAACARSHCAKDQYFYLKSIFKCAKRLQASPNKLPITSGAALKKAGGTHA